MIRSRTFFFFLLGPLFPIVVGILAGGVGSQLAESTGEPQIGIAMQADENMRLITARGALENFGSFALPEMVEVAAVSPGEDYDASKGLSGGEGNIAARQTHTAEAIIGCERDAARNGNGTSLFFLRERGSGNKSGSRK